MSEEMLIRHCSPTLAGMKTASLFTCPYSSEAEIKDDIRRLNHSLVPKGLRVIPLRFENGRALIYIYRPSSLRRDMQAPGSKKLLNSFGYNAANPEKCIVRLTGRIREHGSFPHEIGLFLGYPPEDVLGFITSPRSGFKLTGCWKVYGDAERAKLTFEKFEKCTNIYTALWKHGSSVERLAVAG